MLRTGPGVTHWKPGDRVTVHCNSVDLEGPEGHEDSMLDASQRIWGFETNFGSLADLSLVKANQLMPMPTHLSWEEAASLGLVMATSYRMLVGENAARMKQGDIVLIWGATGGIGGFATQFVLNGGGIPVCVVSPARRRPSCCASIGVEHVIDRKAEGYRFRDDDGEPDHGEMRRFGKQDPRAASAATPTSSSSTPAAPRSARRFRVQAGRHDRHLRVDQSGYLHEYDNRYLWMHLKRIIGSHFANYHEAWEANRLVDLGMIHPILSKTYPLEQAAQAAYEMHHNLHAGKIGVLVGAPEEGLGVQDPAKRERFADRIARVPRVRLNRPRVARPPRCGGGAGTTATSADRRGDSGPADGYVGGVADEGSRWLAAGWSATDRGSGMGGSRGADGRRGRHRRALTVAAAIAAVVAVGVLLVLGTDGLQASGEAVMVLAVLVGVLVAAGTRRRRRRGSSPGRPASP